MRDRRWDFLYDRQRQPVKEYVLGRFAEELARELAAWPPPFVEWVSDELRARWAAGAAERPRDDVLRFALEIARLDLLREFEEIERRLGAEAHRLQTPAEEAALHLLARLVTEKCLGLKEHAEGARIRREDLAATLDEVERRLFRVTAA
ncbi:MAG TPA: hypothetical protein VFL83_02610 [Anaeromyxobacter sp.]|nr:hypothetical protein [Anaeromyxobacter sp.]